MRLVLLLAALAAGSGVLAQSAAAPVEADRALGEYLAGECVGCHQISGKAVGGVPPIVGYPPPAFVIAMQAYKRKERENKVMQTFAGALSDAEIASLAAYFGSLRPQF